MDLRTTWHFLVWHQFKLLPTGILWQQGFQRWITLSGKHALEFTANLNLMLHSYLELSSFNDYEPEENQKFYTEKLVRLDGHSSYYKPPNAPVR